MTAPTRKFRSDVTADTALVSTAETVVGTVAGIYAQTNGPTVFLAALVFVALGADQTSVKLRLRRGTTTGGTLVGELETVDAGVASAKGSPLAIRATDSPGEVSGQSYVVTVEQVGGVANGSVTQASIEADVRR